MVYVFFLYFYSDKWYWICDFDIMCNEIRFILERCVYYSYVVIDLFFFEMMLYLNVCFGCVLFVVSLFELMVLLFR